jgi:Homeodomain-like domain
LGEAQRSASRPNDLGDPGGHVGHRVPVRKRYVGEGLTGGLTDRHRRGRPRTVRRDRRAEILATTLSPPPQALGVTHWSSRLLAAELGVSHSTVARVWAEHDLKPWQVETFKFSTDPELQARVRDVVGLYLDPPAHAIVLAWTRSPRSRRWSGPSRSARYGLAA